MRAMIAGLMGAIMAATQAMGDAYKGNEMPPYTVERADAAYEVRAYGAHLVAEVTVGGDREDAIGAGFRMLAGYIFGGNAAGTKIAMTVPVAQTPDGEGQWTVRFMMPAAFERGSLPAPDDARIRFVDVPPARQVTLRFSGRRDHATLIKSSDDLRTWANGQDLTIMAGPHFYFYDGPMTLPMLRRNEVAFTVE